MKCGWQEGPGWAKTGESGIRSESRRWGPRAEGADQTNTQLLSQRDLGERLTDSCKELEYTLALSREEPASPHRPWPQILWVLKGRPPTCFFYFIRDTGLFIQDPELKVGAITPGNQAAVYSGPSGRDRFPLSVLFSLGLSFPFYALLVFR